MEFFVFRYVILFFIFVVIQSKIVWRCWHEKLFFIDIKREIFSNSQV